MNYAFSIPHDLVAGFSVRTKAQPGYEDIFEVYVFHRFGSAVDGYGRPLSDSSLYGCGRSMILADAVDLALGMLNDQVQAYIIKRNKQPVQAYPTKGQSGEDLLAELGL